MNMYSQFSFSDKFAVVEKKSFWKLTNFWQFFPHPYGSGDAGVLKDTIHVILKNLVTKMLHDTNLKGIEVIVIKKKLKWSIVNTRRTTTDADQ